MKHLLLFPVVTLVLSACMEPQPANIAPSYDQISWDEAKALLADCKVDTVYQSHQLDVILTLKDGTQKATVEPGLDVIFHEVGAHPACGDVGVITE